MGCGARGLIAAIGARRAGSRTRSTTPLKPKEGLNGAPAAEIFNVRACMGRPRAAEKFMMLEGN
jgi:hypothetical protein